MSEEQIYRLYEQALELSPAARPAFLAQACRDDANARREIESLLAAAERDSTAGFMNTPALEKYADVFASPLGDKPMLLNGRYYIPNPNQPLGEGGFGKVYVAYDQRLHDRRVIVKTLKLTPNANINEYIRRKFFGDIDALTRFRHQYIVNILDQGALPDSGEPFFVMDLIEGRSLRDV
ncbi:MAG TPA: protein kinase, partial [Blastocatellia bacterium]|nr:protein kinase [Blastocatellia bacterium]